MIALAGNKGVWVTAPSEPAHEFSALHSARIAAIESGPRHRREVSLNEMLDKMESRDDFHESNDLWK